MPESKNSGSPDFEELCKEAEASGQAFYRDPESGFWVATRRALLDRGYCCETGCRHCPWKNQSPPQKPIKTK